MPGSQAERLQQAKTLLEKYVQHYEYLHQTEADVNYVKHRWALHDIIEHIGYKQTKRLLGYFFKTQGSHDLQRFINQYNELWQNYQRQEADAERRKKLLAVNLEDY